MSEAPKLPPPASFKIVYVAPLKALAAEVTLKFAKRLSWAGIKVRELTGDMKLTKKEVDETAIIVTTPEKWDVVTRRGPGSSDSEVAEVRGRASRLCALSDVLTCPCACRKSSS